MAEPQNIPKTAHWWYNDKQAGVRNPPPANMTGSPPISPASDSGERRFSLTSMLVGSPGAPTFNTGRRDSLKNMYHLSDFGTPDA